MVARMIQAPSTTRTRLGDHIQQLAAFAPTAFPVLSLYLDLVPHQHDHARDAAFVRAALADRLSTLHPHAPERESLERDAIRIDAWLRDQLPPSACGLAIFACSGDGFFDAVQLESPLERRALYVGSVQIRNRATLAGNVCNASPAADTAPALLVYDAEVVAVGPGGRRRIGLADFFVRSGVTTLAPDELVESIELPVPAGARGSVHLRRTRRRGHDLASVTLACAVSPDGVTRIAYGSVGPRPVLLADTSGLLADSRVPDADKAARLSQLFGDASPSPTSMRASPEYRLAMLRVLGLRGVASAIERLAAAS